MLTLTSGARGVLAVNSSPSSSDELTNESVTLLIVSDNSPAALRSRLSVLAVLSRALASPIVSPSSSPSYLIYTHLLANVNLVVVLIAGIPLLATTPDAVPVLPVPPPAAEQDDADAEVLLLPPTIIGVTARPPEPTNGANLPLRAPPTVGGSAAAPPSPPADGEVTAFGALPPASSPLFGIRSYNSVPSGAFGGFGNATTSGFGMFSFGVRTNHSLTLTPGLPSRLAICVTLPRSFFRNRYGAFASYLGGRECFDLARQEQFSLLHLVPLLRVQMLSTFATTSATVGTIVTLFF
uniref:Uncharacterized protein n=1 Tax=Anopheles culicifacies TaxID=139723 RepID=A0A182M3A7_9DIPT